MWVGLGREDSQFSPFPGFLLGGTFPLPETEACILLLSDGLSTSDGGARSLSFPKESPRLTGFGIVITGSGWGEGELMSVR